MFCEWSDEIDYIMCSRIQMSLNDVILELVRSVVQYVYNLVQVSAFFSRVQRMLFQHSEYGNYDADFV